MKKSVSRYDYVRYNEAITKRAELAKKSCEMLDEFIRVELLTGVEWERMNDYERRETVEYRDLARRKLEECFMYIGKTLRDVQRYGYPESQNEHVAERTNE